MALKNYYLGCPGWGTKTWVGRLFPDGTKPTQFLERYARVFNTVEGNTTFYALPARETVERWRDSVPAEFRFCFKFPREITHDKLLVDVAREVDRFLDRIEPLAIEDKLGTLMLQLPPQFAPAMLPRLAGFFAAMPKGFRYAVELRHEAFFAIGGSTPEEDEAMALLVEHEVDLVIMDARGLHAGTSLDVQARKPNLPIAMRATCDRPIVRCVPHEDFAQTLPFLAPWPPQIARWIAEGKQPYFFMHAPDDTFAPENAYAFHALLREHADVGELPPWRPSDQLSLF